MATVAIVLKTSKKLSNNEYGVALRVTHERVTRYISINSLIIDQSNKFRCSMEQWKPAKAEDNGLGRFFKTVPNYKALNSILLEKLLLAKKILKKYDREEESFDFKKFENDLKGNTSPSKKEKTDVTIQEYYQQIIDDLEHQQRIGLATVYRDTKSLLNKFSPNSFLGEVNVSFLQRFESFLRIERGNKDTTISVKMRNLQRVINLAIGDKLIDPQNYPFGERKYSINKRLNHKTRKRSVSLEVIAKIKSLCVDGDFYLQLAKDIFLFGFYTRGMNFIDIAGLKWSDIVDNEIHYVRKKTAQPFYIPINEHVSSVLERYKSRNSSSSYIFPIYNDNKHQTQKQKYTRKKTSLKQVNSDLKKIAKLIGEEDLNLTTYVSRHSYATNLKRAGVATSYISEALGHQTEQQTQVYLDQFEASVLIECEKKIFSS